MNRDRLTTTKAVITAAGSYVLKPRLTNETLGEVVKAKGQHACMQNLLLNAKTTDMCIQKEAHKAQYSITKIFTTPNTNTMPANLVLDVVTP